MTESLRIGIAGLGTVGANTFRILNERKALLEQRSGGRIVVVAVSARDKGRDRGIDVSSVTWHDDARALADDPNVNCVVELIGGEDGIARELVTQALKNKKHVVTANKALIAHHGVELATLAEENGVALLFEAAVAGGIPILKTLKEGLAANRFSRFTGILNGTCNYILTAMTQEGRSFDDVLVEAQEMGYAETPPDLDVDGIDAAHKLAICTALTQGVAIDFDAVYTEGIREVSVADIAFARELGYMIRHLGIVAKTEKGVEQRVHPALVPLDSPMAGVNRVLNATLAEGDEVGSIFMMGPGAGGAATASSVIMDIVDIAAGRWSPSFGIPAAALERTSFLPITEYTGAYYLRLHVKDEGGVLASITSTLNDQGIGVDQVVQRPIRASKSAQIALTTHEANETAITDILDVLAKKDYVLEPPHRIRIEA